MFQKEWPFQIMLHQLGKSFLQWTFYKLDIHFWLRPESYLGDTILDLCLLSSVIFDLSELYKGQGFYVDLEESESSAQERAWEREREREFRLEDSSSIH